MFKNTMYFCLSYAGVTQPGNLFWQAKKLHQNLGFASQIKVGNSKSRGNESPGVGVFYLRKTINQKI